MALSLSFFPVIQALLLALTTTTTTTTNLVGAATVTYDWNITWVTANPDKAFDRPTIGINNQWPLPVLRATVNDTVIINVNNQLGNQSTTLHFHGLFQNGTTQMDGPSQVSQCPIPANSSLTYNFTIQQPGTYWYHSHYKGQYPDGLRAPLIIHDPDSPYKNDYDEEVILSVSDWYHDQMQELIPKFINKANPTGAEPVPNAALFNDTQNLTVPVEAGKTYMFRVVNIGAFAGQYIWFEGHNITIVEVDGIYTEKQEAQAIYLGAAQRCSFLITAKNDTTQNFPFMASMDTTLFDTIPDDLNWNVTGWLQYSTSADLPAAALVDEYNDYDDWNLVPYDREPLLENPDDVITLEVIMDNLGDGASYAFFNNISYVSPKVPTLYTAMTTGVYATNAAVYGEYSHPFILTQNQVIEIVINNDDTGKHPFHLHGHVFQAVYRSASNAGFYDPTNTTVTSAFKTTPMRRDTFTVEPQGFFVVRFRADNPGIWLFHCHIEWHIDSGLVATMVEAPLVLQETLVIPEDHYAACEKGGVLDAGNAAGNTVDLLDLTGENEAIKPLPDGFTPRGIVAMTFSCLAALLGLAAITWYGLAADMSGSELASAQRRIAEVNLPQPLRVG